MRPQSSRRARASPGPVFAAGLAGAAAAGRLIGALPFGVQPDDPLTFAVAVVTGAAAVLATAIPALSAMRVDPAAALRGAE